MGDVERWAVFPQRVTGQFFLFQCTCKFDVRWNSYDMATTF